MKQVKLIPEIPPPGSFDVVVAESSRADLRKLQTGTTFLGAHEVTDHASILLIASSSQFLRSTLQALDGVVSACWLMFVGTDAAQLADMLEGNADWTVDARTAEPDVAAFRIRPSRSDDEELDGVLVGLRLAATLDSPASQLSLPTETARTSNSQFNLMTLVKRHTPRTMKDLAKKILARR